LPDLDSLIRERGSSVRTEEAMKEPFQSAGQTGLAAALVLCIVAGGCATIGEIFPFARGQSEDDPSFAPFVVTPPDVVQEMLRLAEVRSDDVVYDLGSGDGRIVITAAREYGAKGIGFELEPDLVRRARGDARRAGVADLAEFYVQDVMTVDLTGATVVTIYLSREANTKLRPRLLSQLRPGSRVVSHQFDMGDWQPSRILNYRDTSGTEHILLLWRIPESLSK
jgi:SAM-dependent methyltransferase